MPAHLLVDPRFVVGEVDRRLFGSFVEHMGRCVYTGVFEPGHPAARPDGLRADVLDLVRELGVTLLRYPGGNYVSGHRWEDGVGPVDERPRRLEPAWRSIETNRFGLHEFAGFCEAAGVEPMLAVNLGSRGATEAAELVEYATSPAGTLHADRRVANGLAEPIGVRTWCLGNELDGPWQIGHRSAAEYGRLAAQTAELMWLINPDAELVLSGSSGRHMPTFGRWEDTVLELAWTRATHISLHAYYEEHDGDVDSFLASAHDMEAMIDGVVATADAVGARLRSPKRMQLSFDEWNVWYTGRGRPDPDWSEAPRLLENVYSVTDAVVVGSLLITLLRHCDRVTVACLAQLVNVIAPIMTEPGGPAWRQTTFHPFADAARHGRGTVLRSVLTSPEYDTAAYGTVPLVHVVAVLSKTGDTLTVFAVNRSTSTDMPLTVELGGATPAGPATHRVLADPDRHAVNRSAEPGRVAPREAPAPVVDGAVLRAVLPPLSWNVLRLPVLSG